MARAEGRSEDAIELYEACVTEARGLYAADPTPQAAVDLAEALTRVAGQEEAEGRVEAALAPYEESLALHRRAAEAAPDDCRAGLGLVGALSRLADCRDARGHRSRARDLYAEAVTLAEGMSWRSPRSTAYSEALEAARARLAALEAEMFPERTDLTGQ